MKNLLTVLTLLFTITFSATAQCIDPNLIDPTAACILVFDPVCGCDGNTYSNSCFATIEGGVTDYIQGACEPNNTECIDPSLIDPNGFCTLEYDPVCGCDGNTYSNGCFATIQGGVTSYSQGTCEPDNTECLDPSLIDPNAACISVYDPVCGCDGKTYSNSCIASIEGGVTIYTPGTCPPNESYTICAGESVQIGLPGMIGNTILTWNPTADLSCTSCPNPITSPSETTIYELKIFTTIGFTTVYEYYEVIVDDNCPCEEGVFPESAYLYSIGTFDIPQSTATAFYSWADLVWTDNLCDWFWDFDNGITSTDSNPDEIGFSIIQNAQPVTEPYNICLTVKDCNGNIEIDCCEKFYPNGNNVPLCELPPDVGPCDGICPRWYYNAAAQDCLEFDWGCCDGNANNFESYEVCINACNNGCDTNNLPWLQLPTCDNCYSKVEVVEYNNQTLIAFWADDNACSDAMTIVYNCDGSVYCYQGGIAGFQQCTDLINAYTTVETLWDKNTDCDACALPPDPGLCLAAFLRYYFNPASQTCETFTWGGCGGNANNFTSFEACMSACGANACPAVLDLGTLPLNSATYQAQQIIYGGNINANQQVKFKVSERITIENGFTVPATSEFKVEFGNCN